MSVIRQLRSTFTASFVLFCGVDLCAGQGNDGDLQREIHELRIRNKTLEGGIAEANRAERDATEQLNQVRHRLEALGRHLLDGGDERLIQATSDIQILNERIGRIEHSSAKLSGAVSDYLRQAVASDPQARLRVETSMRELDEALGLVKNPAPPAQNSGTANRAKVMSIDPESGLLVLNIGAIQGTRIGTSYRLYRGDQPYGTAIIADVRRSIAGAFVEMLEREQGPVRLGDLVILETE